MITTNHGKDLDIFLADRLADTLLDGVDFDRFDWS
jgi:hypothetical protein